ncbi:MAG TPA: class I SAM-dependent methyltransferase [Anaerolineae bacterium]|mgnify:CR=1 FL=1|nr:class I SAM-dependent methyltransferase [Anaerolineae bacterium]HQK12470.1 class I SAM-dependent methyltransferase [Anaerolineae bacterium]
MTSSRPICNYEGSRYSTEFWNTTRAYEDAVERVAMRALLPPQGRTLVEIGAGFGRMADLYAGYETVVLFDYAHTQLAQAVERLGECGADGHPHYLFVQGDFYRLPFVAGLFDAVTMVRTLHHAADAPGVLRGIADILGPGGVFVLEFANKLNLKAIARYLLRRQTWSPFALEPVEFVALNFDFHPRWMWAQLEQVGLRREAVRTVSHFRINLVKRLIPTRVLTALDALLQPTGALWQLSPSVFTRARADAGKSAASTGAFFRCPACGAPLGAPPQVEFRCACGKVWRREGLIYNFRDPA